MTTTTDSHANADTRAGNLADLIRGGASREAIARHLDGLSSSERVAQVRSIGHGLVGKLYEAVAGGDPLTMNDLVPEGETGTVIFEGKNSLPAFTLFQKRFSRVGKDLVGYNHQLAVVSMLTGPGYFVVRPPTAGEPHPDELFFDYTIDTPAVPGGWPAFTPNDVGFSRLVYMNMKDYCRRVANGVLVGKAYKSGKPEGNFFTLTRP
jgi:hypothetical protein